MEKIIIKNGLVYDPINEVKGEVKDLLIEEGKIVDKFTSDTEVKEIDASNKTVIPAALDIHTHVASRQMNWVRLLGTKNDLYQKVWKGLTLENIAKKYISNGYTFILEANVYPSLAKKTTFDFMNLPGLDKAMLLNVSNLWALETEFEKEKIEDITYFLSDLLNLSKGFGFKLYNPFEAESWNFNVLREDLETKGRLYSFSPLKIYSYLTQAVEKMKLPHSIHGHIDGYENEKGQENIIKVLELVKDIKLESESQNRTQVFHLAHANAYNINGDNSKLIDLLNTNDNLDIDLGMLSFNEINPLITSDRRLIHSYLNSDDYRVITNAVETEGDSFATLRQLKKSNKKDCHIWANAIELALKIKNKWQVQLSYNFPNYSDISNNPKISTWLVSKKARDAFMKDMNDEFLGETALSSLDDELTFFEYVILTRASPAKSLGLSKIKGGFSLGSDGDLNILDINMDDVSLSDDFEKLEKALDDLEYVIKGGAILKHEDKINLENNGKIFWSEGKVDQKAKKDIMKKKREFYQKYYSIFYNRLECTVNPAYLRKIEY